MKLWEAKQIARRWGVTITSRPETREYRVNFVDGTEATASYSTDLDDAIGTAAHMSGNMVDTIVLPAEQPGPHPLSVYQGSV